MTRPKPVVVLRLPWWWWPNALAALALAGWCLWAGWTGVVDNAIFRPIAVVAGFISVVFVLVFLLWAVATRGRIVVGAAESLTLYRPQPWVGPLVTRLEGDLRDVEMTVHVGTVMDAPEGEANPFAFDPRRQLSKTTMLTIEFAGSTGELWTQVGRVKDDYEARFAEWKKLVEAHHATD